MNRPIDRSKDVQQKTIRALQPLQSELLSQIQWDTRILHKSQDDRSVADLGCSPGYYTLPLAESICPEGKVYAVDSDEKAIRALEKKADKRGIHNIKAYVLSASDLNFIKDESVDFILASGLLCTMAPQQHESAVNEMKRVLKPKGQMYLDVGRGPWSYVSREEWETILEGFRVERRGGDGFNPRVMVSLADRWALVSVK